MNNPTKEDIPPIKALLDSRTIIYLCFGEEVAPTTGTPHYQGYLELSRKYTLNSLKKLLGNRYHLVARLGTQQQAIDYCKKDHKFHEFGERKKQGERTDLVTVRSLAVTGGIRAVIDEGCTYMHLRYAEKVLPYIEPKRDFKTYVVWISGPSGSGKSHKARELAPDAYWKTDTTKWWDGYDIHEDVVLDDFRLAGDLTFRYMLGLMDKFPFRVEFKGGSRQFLAKRLVITAPFPPDDVVYLDEDKTQFVRRIDERLTC